MYYITILYETTHRSRRTLKSRIKLRGYDRRTWVDAEFAGLQLPVNALAYAICPTSREVYLQRVCNQSTEETWERYKGRMIDEIYKIINNECRDYVRGIITRKFDLYNHMIEKSEVLLDKAKRKHRRALRDLSQQPAEEDTAKFDQDLEKIVRSEALIAATWTHFELSRVRSANARRIFDQYFNFNTDFALTAPHQGFTTPATPDFIYRHKVMGDIKTGTWHDFLEYTIIAYALAYEEDTSDDMNHGAILYVDIPDNRPVPTHYFTDIIYLDDEKRKRFLALRDRRLQIIGNKSDPGTPSSQSECNPECPYLSSCWEGA